MKTNSKGTPSELPQHGDLRAVMQGDVVLPDDVAYANARRIWNGAVTTARHCSPCARL